MTTITTPKSIVAKAIFDEVSKEGFKLPEGFKSPRGVFIQRSMKEAGLTHAGASTYYQNFKNEAKGGKRYWSPKKEQPAVTEETK